MSDVIVNTVESVSRMQAEIDGLKAEVRRLSALATLNEGMHGVASWDRECLQKRRDELEAELQRFREREPLVQQLLEDCGAFNVGTPTVQTDMAIEDAALVRDFELTPSVKCPSQADGSGNDLTPAVPADAAESHEKGGFPAG